MRADLEQKYQELIEEAKSNDEIIGIVLSGSRSKDSAFITDHSDIDVRVIIANHSSSALIEHLDKLKREKLNKSQGFDMSVSTLEEFRQYAAWGSENDWDRYMFAKNKAVIDKTGEIQDIIDQKGTLPDEARDAIITGSLDAYVNSVYRSAKHWRDGNEFAAHLDAAESLPPLMTALYALEGRLKPYNKYFEWELKKYPLTHLPWPLAEFVQDYTSILKTGDIEIQKKIFTGTKKLFIEQGYNEVFAGWEGYYFVGE